MANENDPLWVFGYGSLMWRPGFDYVSSHRARIAGVHRAPCIYSWVHRGTQERPGIVLGLDRGGACVGMAFEVEQTKKQQTLDYLRARELVTHVYVETERKIQLADGRDVTAVTYVVDRKHPQYAGRLDDEALLQQIRGAVGQSGPNEAYILGTADHLEEMGIRDTLIGRIAKELRQG